ncbi:ring-cleaving dioxygenase [Halospeciosus flavus]|uniref:Ring-cleaving dioxygenase n=1 Tax=Halospeciosus flavus TaxID=3032283 RepID=A0ABD5Z1G4_9EURY|nr:ring-cleaving dioxygenase [Halospeciosus flavus]
MSNPTPTPGIHHVTCVASDPQRNLDFWVETLGLRLVKRSINQDDPSTYHFFFADAEGTPGTSMTFFPWGDTSQGKVGSGQVSRTAFRVPEGSLDYWETRFDEYGVDYDDRVERFGETVLPFRDPDGLPVELVEVEIPADDPTVPWTAFVPESAAIRGFHSVTLWLADPYQTEELLRTMGFEEVGTEQAQGDTPGDERTRFAAAGPVGAYVDVLPTIASGRQGCGTVHHVAFQTPTDDDQASMRTAVRSAGLSPTPQIDRHWFRSVYFREFGGVLFELATRDPGYDSDEPLDDLGGRLVLPGEFEARRDQIEAGLPDVTIPQADSADGDDADSADREPDAEADA